MFTVGGPNGTVAHGDFVCASLQSPVVRDMETNCLKTNTDVSDSRNKEPIAYCIRASLRHFVKIINEFSGEEEKRSLLEHLRVELSDGWCPPRCRSTLLRIVLLLVACEFSLAKAYEFYSSSRSSLVPALQWPTVHYKHPISQFRWTSVPLLDFPGYNEGTRSKQCTYAAQSIGSLVYGALNYVLLGIYGDSKGPRKIEAPLADR